MLSQIFTRNRFQRQSQIQRQTQNRLASLRSSTARTTSEATSSTTLEVLNSRRAFGSGLRSFAGPSRASTGPATADSLDARFDELKQQAGSRDPKVRFEAKAKLYSGEFDRAFENYEKRRLSTGLTVEEHRSLHNAQRAAGEFPTPVVIDRSELGLGGKGKTRVVFGPRADLARKKADFARLGK